MEKRFILAMILSMLFVVLYRYMFVPPTPQQTSPPPQSAGNSNAASKSPQSPVPPETAASAPAAEAAQAPVTQAAPLTVRIEDSHYRVTLTNQGGGLLTSWKFLERKGQEVELIHQGTPAGAYGPLALWTSDAQLTQQLNSVYYTLQNIATAPGEAPVVFKTPAEISFTYQGPNFRASKTYRFKPSSYLVEITAEVTSNGRPVPLQLQVGPGLGASDQALGSDTRHMQKVAVLNGNSVDRQEFKKIEAPQQQSGVIRWAGIESQYFATVALPQIGRTFSNCQIRPFMWKEGDQEIPLAVVDTPIAAGDAVRVYIGPKEGQVLESIDPTLGQVIDLGWFSIVVKPLLWALNLIHDAVRNYGWAIIILTFLITLALFPLRYKQMVSMKKMQKLQPQVKAIQERYKKAKKSAEERQKMNTEMMALYKEHGVNPLGGCLPLLLQMPILFAFYSMLANAFELRGAPFMLWIQDLSARDPYYVTPLVMGVTMLISMKMTPTTSTDPVQNKMMMIMPIMMTFMFLNLSAGLNLYFLFSNVFSIAMQKVSEHYLPSMRTA